MIFDCHLKMYFKSMKLKAPNLVTGTVLLTRKVVKRTVPVTKKDRPGDKVFSYASAMRRATNTPLALA